VGKTTAVQVLARNLAEQGWSIVEVGSSRLTAGKPHLGEVEKAVEDLIRVLQTCRRTIWYVPEFAHLQWAGRHASSPVSVLDLIAPAVRRGEIRVLGEISNGELDRLQQRSPSGLVGFHTIRMGPSTTTETSALVKRLARTLDPAGRPLSSNQAGNLVSLTDRFSASLAQPGAAASLTRRTYATLATHAKTGRLEIVREAGAILGLPVELADTSRAFDASELRRSLSARILGQEEAVAAVVSRIAYMKAGLAQRGRPLGVFLLAGPTGTGKTELALQTSRYLVGSESGCIRLDMSEYQDPGSGQRLLGEPDPWGDRGTSLASKVRQHPFAVILLDEIEKAHPSVWDMLLQVFDAGKLTDHRGRAVNFEAALIFMTTNLGARSASSPTIGYNEEEQRFDTRRISEAIAEEFRPELVNRIDRVLVFHPLSPLALRAILDRELQDLQTRPGLANKRWRLRVDASAKARLLELGTSAQHGARPLRRAIEQHLLEPLATRLAEHAPRDTALDLLVTCSGQDLQFEFRFRQSLAIAGC
jgi:ATP-dependent Clp protease ATP-binding subunit ClpC